MFRAPVPPGLPFPPGKTVFWAAESDSGEGREYEDIMLRKVPGRGGSPVPRRGRARAGFTHAQYLTALVSLHEAMRKRADDGDADMAAALGQLGLGTVSI